MGKQGPDQFLAELIRSEDTKSVLVLSSGNLSELIGKLEDSLDRLTVIPTGDVNLQETFDMCIVLEDIEVSKTELGLIKNSVAQKILVIRESVDDTDHQSFLELLLLHLHLIVLLVSQLSQQFYPLDIALL